MFTFELAAFYTDLPPLNSYDLSSKNLAENAIECFFKV